MDGNFSLKNVCFLWFPSTSIILSIFLISLPEYGNSCAQTTTLQAPAVTTTTSTTTTTTTTNPCASCTLATITLTQGDGVNTATPTTPGVQCCDAAGCSTLVVTCTALPGGQVFMQFNINQGGPLNPIGTVVTATLNCNAMGQWEFRPGMGQPNRVITEVNCVLAGGG